MKERRKWDRYPYDKKLELSFPGSWRFTGDIKNISLGGLFLLDPVKRINLKVGAAGAMRLFSGKDQKEFSCMITRVDSEGVALKVMDKHQSEFGFAVYLDVIGSISLKGGLSSKK